MASSSSEMPKVPFTTAGVRNEYTAIRMPNLESQGMIMVSAPFSGSHWLSWSRSVRMALESKDKLNFIDGSGLRPVIGTPQYKQWRITDCLVRTWILNTISKDLVNAYLYANLSRDLWMELEARYGECDGTLLYKLQREISSISQGNMSMTEYYTKLKQLWDELICLMPPAVCSCGLCVCGCNKIKAEQSDASQLIQFLMGLNDSYDNIRSQILVLEPLPLVNKAYSTVLRVERRRLVNSEYSEVGEASAMKAYEYKHKTGPKNFTRSKGPTDKRHLFCEHCSRNGHNKESCFKLHGFPDWYKELRDQRRKQSINGHAYAVVDAAQSSAEAPHSNGVQLMSELLDALRMVQNKIPQDPVNVHFAQDEEMAGMTVEYSYSIGCNSVSWIVDTGATSHMCGDVKLFQSLTSLKAPKCIYLPNNSTTLATQSGDIQLCFTLTLTNVLLVPSFPHNLLSVSQLCSSHNLSFSFHNSFCVLQDLKADRVLAIGKQHKHLYYLEPLSFVSVPTHTNLDVVHALNSASAVNKNDFILWHQRLGHSSPDVMKHIITVDISKPPKEHTCSICPLAKQTRVPFCLSTSSTVSCFDLIHVDIWGPYKQATLSGAHYVLTIVDDFSRATWTFLMHHKSQTLKTLTAFFAQILTQFSCKIKAVRTNNGSEFLSSHCQTLRLSVVSDMLPTFILVSPSLITEPLNPTIPLPTSESDDFLDSAAPLTDQSSCSDDAPHVDTLPLSEPTSPPHSADFPSPPCLRRSQRISHPPAWLHDFVCHSSHHFSFTFTSSHSVFQAALSTIHEPQCYNQAKDSIEWKQAMQSELRALEQNQTWDVTDLPPNKKPIGCKWVYKIKLNPDGSVERYKARLVAKGYNQVEGIDYFDRFSPVAKVVTIRVFLTVATGSRWPIHQIDINNAFLHGFLDEDIYIQAPAGYVVPSGKCCKLKRSLSNASLIILLVYVDDLLITGPFESLITEVKMFLDTAFSIKDLGYAKYFLGLEIARSPSGTSITQHKYVRDIIADAGFDQCKPASTLFPLGLKLSSQSSPSLDDPEPFCRLVGRLLYLGFTRPDVSYAAQQLSQFVHAPCQIHLDAALHLLRYLAGSPDLGLFIPASSSSTLKAYCDADWASCVDTRRSLTGLGATVCEIPWLAYLLQDFHITVSTPIPLFCDNQAALHIVANPVFHKRTKHLEIDCHLVRDKFKSGFILPMHIPGKLQLVDVFTKAVPGPSSPLLCPSWVCCLSPVPNLRGGCCNILQLQFSP
ncbi:UNVERIFIED_CONTAM: Retrovirus-related Pol polyprotein from transposon RE1 [Sesamum indicum]